MQGFRHSAGGRAEKVIPPACRALRADRVSRAGHASRAGRDFLLRGQAPWKAWPASGCLKEYHIALSIP